jgi:GxxExxY protein
MNWAQVNSVSGAIIACAVTVHSTLGPGLLESTYEARLIYEIQKKGISVAQQVGLPVVYEGQRLEVGYRIDLLVDNLVIVEIKAIEALAPIHRAQLLSYLKLSGKPLGLLLNFNVPLMKDGIVRMRNG